jgi:transcriptional regulator with XRE-family HTH domain
MPPVPLGADHLPPTSPRLRYIFSQERREVEMKKVVPNGRRIKEAREQLTKGTLQKEMAPAVGISIRSLRQIENANHPVTIPILDRIASYLHLPKEQIAFAIDSPKLVPDIPKDVSSIVPDRDQDRLVPRHDEECATACMDEGALLKDACTSHDMKVHIDTKLTDETTACVQELTSILTSLTWTERDCLQDLPATDEVGLRRRIRQLLVLLKGNDVWVYPTKHCRRLRERYTITPEGEKPTFKMRLTVAFGAPGEYGELSRLVPVDNGQPFVLPSLDKLLRELGGKAK